MLPWLKTSKTTICPDARRFASAIGKGAVAGAKLVADEDIRYQELANLLRHVRYERGDRPIRNARIT
jgi:hypothetical protein